MLPTLLNGWIVVLVSATVALSLCDDRRAILAQESGTEPPDAATESAEEMVTPDDAGDSDSNKTGTASESPSFNGPNSVAGQLDKDEQAEPILRIEGLHRLLEPYRDFKQTLKDDHGLAFGLDYNALLQVVSQSPGEEIAAGGVFRFYGRWSLLGADSKNSGTFVYKVENRHRLGTNVAPSDLASELGYAGLTAVGFSDADWLLTNLFWQQELLDGRLAVLAGVVDTTDYVDTYSLVNPWIDFENFAFSNGPTISSPSQGLGAAVAVLMTQNLYAVGGLADTNGDPHEPWEGFETFFGDAEFFTHAELGWISSLERRYLDNVHLTAWHADSREEAQVPSGWGLAFSFNRLVEEKWEPFLRAGYSDGGGALWEWSAATGIGYHLRRNTDVIGLGLSWSRPSESVFGADSGDQFTSELYYRLQLSQQFAIIPDVQVLVNPALNPDDDVIGVFGLRARVTF